jgi:hypothetical protein
MSWYVASAKGQAEPPPGRDGRLLFVRCALKCYSNIRRSSQQTPSRREDFATALSDQIRRPAAPLTSVRENRAEKTVGLSERLCLLNTKCLAVRRVPAQEKLGVPG